MWLNISLESRGYLSWLNKSWWVIYIYMCVCVKKRIDRESDIIWDCVDLKLLVVGSFCLIILASLTNATCQWFACGHKSTVDTIYSLHLFPLPFVFVFLFVTIQRTHAHNHPLSSIPNKQQNQTPSTYIIPCFHPHFAHLRGCLWWCFLSLFPFLLSRLSLCSKLERLN